MQIRVLYLFTGYRKPHLEKTKRGEEQGNGFWGMLRLHKFGVEAKHLELEQFLPLWLCRVLRKYVLSVYWVHLPIYPAFFSYDIVFTSTGYGTQLVHTLLHVKKPRWVMHDFSVMGLIGKEKTTLQKVFAWMVSRCAGIVTISKKEKDLLEARFPNLRGKVEFIPYGVDLNFFTPAHMLGEGAIFAPGRDPDRDIKLLFAATEGLGKELIITTRQSRLEKLKPLPAHVLHKTFSVPELKTAYENASVVVIPLDTSNGLNNEMGISAVYEALAMGKPIVASRSQGMEAYIEDGVNGVLVPQHDVRAMRDAIKRLLGDRELRERLGRNARTYAEQNLDPDRCTQQLAEFFKKIAAD
ncbi:glycosyltransferase family 4 protein [Patescibacteria group bacterium]|nr:glycosyltransferase family 4 protein [Patescibacteria group bacterium]